MSRDVVTQVRKTDPYTLPIKRYPAKRYHLACFEKNHANYDDPAYWTYQWFSEEWSSKPTCDDCGQVIQREQKGKQDAKA